MSYEDDIRERIGKINLTKAKKPYWPAEKTGEKDYYPGTEEFDKLYYELGEYHSYGDLGNLGAPLMDLFLSQGKKNFFSSDFLPYLQSFIHILQLVRDGNDDLYISETREFVAETLLPHKKIIDKLLVSTPISFNQIKSLQPIYKAWQKRAHKRF